MELKPVYKKTEAGVIPDDWEISTVGKEFEIKLGKMLDAEKNVGVRKPYLGNKAVQWGHIDVTNLPTMAMSPSDLETFRLLKGDLLVCEGGEVGRAALWEEPLAECYYQKALHRLRPLHGFNSRLMAELLRYWCGNGHLNNYVTQTSIAHLTREKFALVPLPVPKPAEQRAIAAALADVDALLGSLDRLIAKKRDLKQAVMQQLLTGRTRLTGFSAKWKTMRFGDFVSIRNQKVQPSNVGFNTACVELEHLGQGDGRLLGFAVARDSTSSKYRFLAGDVLFGRLRSYLRKFWLATHDGVCSTEIWPLMVDPDRAFNGFLHALVQMPAFVEVTGMSYGTHMPRADWGVVRNFEVGLPGLDEQRAIAAVLFDMDAELIVLEERLGKTRLLKQGMMQELLTGRTRLV